jgi:tetrapyrrole methylase family protein / MazG family protein
MRTLGVQRALDGAARIVLRTAVHPGLDDLVADPRVSTCDDLYEGAASFDEVYDRVVDRLLSQAETGDFVFAVPGHPFFGERSVARLRQRAPASGIPIVVLPATSALDVVSMAVGADLLADQVQLLDAVAFEHQVAGEPFTGGSLDVSPSRSCLVSQVYSASIASAVKLALGRVFPDHHPIKVVRAAGIAGQETTIACELHELDRQPMDHLTTVWVPALATLDATRSAATLHRITGILRSPTGCPWDRRQNHASLRAAVIEEAHEVVDAIDEGEPEQLAEELGDLLLQVALHAQIAEQAGEFVAEDVYDHVNRKLVRRHPHVFGNASASTPEEVVRTWDGIKLEERSGKTPEPVDVDPDPFDRLPRSMPVLTRVAAALAGLDQSDTAPDGTAVDRLLTAVEDVVRAGLDPERELERAYRRRRAAGQTPHAESSAVEIR